MASNGHVSQVSGKRGGGGGAEPRVLLMAALAIAALVVPGVTPPIALGVGILLALAGLTARTKQATKIAKYLIQVAVVLLGLGMDLKQVGEAGLVGLLFAAGTIVGTFALGVTIGKLLKIDAKLTTLLSSGTAICGGSAIAATASVIAATEAHIAVAMGAVFLLNAIAIYLFPMIGHELHLTQQQFGTWAAVAIHDVSSVVGAAGVYDRAAAAETGHATVVATGTATAVKLTRTLWIAPVAMACAWWFRSRGEVGEGKKKAAIPIPWFVLWFVAAAGLGTVFKAYYGNVAPGDEVAVTWTRAAMAWLPALAKDRLMSVALFLIGCGLSPRAVASVGWRAMVLAVVMWVAISCVALFVVTKIVI